MNYQYKVYYTLLVPVPEAYTKERDMVITAMNPVKALDIFHKNVQSFPSKTANGVVTRPALKAEDYKLTKFAQCYKDETAGRPLIESEIDLPQSPNPDTKSKPVEPVAVQNEMPLDDKRR
jgi:hypothetical protein